MTQQQLSLIDNAGNGDPNALDLLDVMRPGAMDALQASITGLAKSVDDRANRDARTIQSLRALCARAADAIENIYDGCPDSPTLSLGSAMEELREAGEVQEDVITLRNQQDRRGARLGEHDWDGLS